ncbi:MAG: hypothetical protein AAGC60_02580 [Acidobacteriota bacterium]
MRPLSGELPGEAHREAAGGSGRSRASGSGRRLGEVLVAEGQIDRDQLRRALEMQQMIGGRLGTNLLEIGALEEPTLLAALGAQRATCTVGGDELEACSDDVLRLLPSKLARRYQLVPYRLRGKTLYIASADPGDALHEDEIAFLTSTMVRTCIALESQLALALHRAYGVAVDTRFRALAERRRRSTGAQAAVVRRRPETDVPAPVESAPVRSAPVEPGTVEPGTVEPRATDAGSSTSPWGGAWSTKPEAAGAAPSEPVQAEALDRSSAPGDALPDQRSPSPRRVGAPAAPEREFIELDTDDLALLRRDAEPADRVAPRIEAMRSATPAAAPATDEAPPASRREAANEAPRDVEQSLRRAARQLQEAEIRDEIGDVLLEFAAPFLRRRVLFFARKDQRILGWQGGGEGIDQGAVRQLDFDARLPSLFSSLRDSSSYWLGPLAPLPENRKLLALLGEPAPRECLALPVVLRGKVICYLYGDNLDEGVAQAPLEALRRLVRKAGVAFEVYILKNKIRIL